MNRMLLAALVVTACGERTPPESRPLAVELSAEAQRVYPLLTRRHPVRCVEIFAAASTETLLQIVDRVQAPPWAPMQAAGCLIQHRAEQIEPQLVRWVGAEKTRGLAFLVVAQLDRLEEPLALRVAQAAVSGANGAALKRRIASSRRPAVRAIVEDGSAPVMAE